MTDRYAVIGNPVMHSKSPLIHTAFAQETGQNIEYTKLEAPLDGFRRVAEQFRAEGGRGLNVTTPFKLDAFQMATDLSERARFAGAVNALKFDGHRIHAENFDGIGLVNDIQKNLGCPMRGRRVLLMGAGGAVRGALLPFIEQQPDVLVIANRTPAKARALASDYASRGNVRGCGYDDLAGEHFDVVVNGTSASLKGEMPHISVDIFGKDSLAYELVYGKGLTPFLRTALESGTTRIADGVGMLVEQAAEAFEWWRGVRPNTTTLIKRMAVPLV